MSTCIQIVWSIPLLAPIVPLYPRRTTNWISFSSLWLLLYSQNRCQFCKLFLLTMLCCPRLWAILGSTNSRPLSWRSRFYVSSKANDRVLVMSGKLEKASNDRIIDLTTVHTLYSSSQIHNTYNSTIVPILLYGIYVQSEHIHMTPLTGTRDDMLQP